MHSRYTLRSHTTTLKSELFSMYLSQVPIDDLYLHIVLDCVDEHQAYTVQLIGMTNKNAVLMTLISLIKRFEV